MTHNTVFDKSSDFPENPNEQLGFEIDPGDKHWSFIPEFYPSDFTQMKKRKLRRYGGGCEGESVSLKQVKNREIHIKGLMLRSELATFQEIMDYNQKVDLLSPVNPDGGMECFIKSAELGNQKGYDPQTQQRIFEYRIDLISTGRDETDHEQNAIVTAIVGGNEVLGTTDDTFISPLQ